jgi:hypothetical protein
MFIPVLVLPDEMENGWLVVLLSSPKSARVIPAMIVATDPTDPGAVTFTVLAVGFDSVAFATGVYVRAPPASVPSSNFAVKANVLVAPGAI